MRSTISKSFLWFDIFSKRDENEIKIISTLKANQLFMHLSRKELRLVTKFVHVRHYEPGEPVFVQDEKSFGMYMIAKGAVEIKMRSSQTHTQEEHAITTLGVGSFFGELALIDQDSKRTASSYAQGPTTLIGFFKQDLMDVIERRPETGIKILMQLSKVLRRRLYETTEALTQAVREPTYCDHCRKEFDKKSAA